MIQPLVSHKEKVPKGGHEGQLFVANVFIYKREIKAAT
jgi:hypothetical protein